MYETTHAVSRRFASRLPAAALLLAACAVGAGARQSANTSKANRPSAATPAATRQQNPAGAARPAAQPPSPAAPPQAKQLWHRYEITKFYIAKAAGGYEAVVGVRNAGDAAVSEGDLWVGVVYVDDAKKVINCVTSGGAMGWSGCLGAGVKLPALKPGQSALFKVPYYPSSHTASQYDATLYLKGKKWRYGIRVSARKTTCTKVERSQTASGESAQCVSTTTKGEAEYVDFLPGEFIQP